MASADDIDVNEVCKAMEKFCAVSGKAGTQMNSKAFGKMVADCIDKKTDVKNRMDSSVFPTVCDKKTKCIDCSNKDQVDKLLTKAAEQYKDIKKSSKDVSEVKKDLAKKICSGGPNIKEVKASATGGVDRMTDTSKYTGAHKERFDESGKGKGATGREDRVDNTGYVGNYKGEGSYGKK